MDFNLTQQVANFMPAQGVNINISGVKVDKRTRDFKMQIDLDLLQTDMWFTAFGMGIKQL